MVTARAPWSEAAAHWLAREVSTGTPVLGVCYGHQLLAHACGGLVGALPAGREIGTRPVQLAPGARNDRLLAALPDRFPAHLTHQESVIRLPPAATWLGRSQLDPNQIFRIGQHAWGVQFHPEFDEAVMRGYLEGRTDTLQREGLDVTALLQAVQHTPAPTRLIRRFGELVLEDR